MNEITRVFITARKTGRKALIPYLMAGYPSLRDTERLVIGLEEAGADIVELGIPFTDPVADGPTIQRASEHALKQGVTLRKVLALVRRLRKKTDIPLVLMTYYNPVFRYGDERFISESMANGVNGVIIPDLIPDEARDFTSRAKKHGLATIFLLAPTSTPERIRKVVHASSGFIYYVSLTGITGARLSLDKTMKKNLSAIRSMTSKPVAVGFGISSPREASAISRLADGVIIGSAIVRLISEKRDIRTFVQRIRKAL